MNEGKVLLNSRNDKRCLLLTNDQQLALSLPSYKWKRNM